MLNAEEPVTDIDEVDFVEKKLEDFLKDLAIYDLVRSSSCNVKV